MLFVLIVVLLVFSLLLYWFAFGCFGVSRLFLFVLLVWCWIWFTLVWLLCWTVWMPYGWSLRCFGWVFWITRFVIQFVMILFTLLCLVVDWFVICFNLNFVVYFVCCYLWSSACSCCFCVIGGFNRLFDLKVFYFSLYWFVLCGILIWFSGLRVCLLWFVCFALVVWYGV